MSFKEFCKQQGLTKEEKRQAAIYLIAFRLFKMWEALMGDDE